jgi:DNA topoisomerase-2
MIRVWNNGDGIPVEVHKEEGVYVPELIFGHLLTSSNYDDHEKKVRGCLAHWLQAHAAHALRA